MIKDIDVVIEQLKKVQRQNKILKKNQIDFKKWYSKIYKDDNLEMHLEAPIFDYISDQDIDDALEIYEITECNDSEVIVSVFDTIKEKNKEIKLNINQIAEALKNYYE